MTSPLMALSFLAPPRKASRNPWPKRNGESALTAKRESRFPAPEQQSVQPRAHSSCARNDSIPSQRKIAELRSSSSPGFRTYSVRRLARLDLFPLWSFLDLHVADQFLNHFV